jgi:hypothetical protein
MTLYKHIIDSIKEWQLKIGMEDTGIQLYYPKVALCGYFSVPESIENKELAKLVSENLKENAPFLGKPQMTVNKNDRFCFKFSAEACDYIDKHVEMPAFLNDFLTCLKKQSLEEIRELFKNYADKYGDSYHEETEDEEMGHVFFFDSEDTDPYVYCVDDDGIALTYHRFARSDYEQLKE